MIRRWVIGILSSFSLYAALVHASDGSAASTGWDWVYDKAWAAGYGLIGVVGFLMNMRMEDIKGTAKSALPREEFTTYLEDQREYRAHREVLDQRVTDKIDTHAAETSRRFDEIRTLIIQSK